MRLAELVAEYDRPQEGPGRVRLLERMEALGGVSEAGRLAQSADAGERYVAARLMHLLPDDRHLEPLRALVLDEEPRVAGEARDALRTQRRTPEWVEAVRALTQAPDGSLRAAAVEWLSET